MFLYLPPAIDIRGSFVVSEDSHHRPSRIQAGDTEAQTQGLGGNLRGTELFHVFGGDLVVANGDMSLKTPSDIRPRGTWRREYGHERDMNRGLLSFSEWARYSTRFLGMIPGQTVLVRAYGKRSTRKNDVTEEIEVGINQIHEGGWSITSGTDDHSIQGGIVPRTENHPSYRVNNDNVRDSGGTSLKLTHGERKFRTPWKEDRVVPERLNLRISSRERILRMESSCESAPSMKSSNLRPIAISADAEKQLETPMN
ncbi:hypothetical protein B0H19DRAFT_1066931 [Mycena capillaripes]|nr:hypothetical protein B0H19DRAFT_1066931 [Mycena capillaripes]